MFPLAFSFLRKHKWLHLWMYCRSDAFIMYELQKLKQVLLPDLSRRPGQPVNHRFVTCCCSLAHGARKEEQNVNFLRCHYVRDGYTSDKSAVYHGADARRQTRTVTLTRTDNSESINLTWLSWECWSQPTRHSETSRKSWKWILELLNIFVAFEQNLVFKRKVRVSAMHNQGLDKTRKQLQVCKWWLHQHWQVYHSSFTLSEGHYIWLSTTSDCLWQEISWTAPWGSNSASKRKPCPAVSWCPAFPVLSPKLLLHQTTSCRFSLLCVYLSRHQCRPAQRAECPPCSWEVVDSIPVLVIPMAVKRLVPVASLHGAQYLGLDFFGVRSPNDSQARHRCCLPFLQGSNVDNQWDFNLKWVANVTSCLPSIQSVAPCSLSQWIFVPVQPHEEKFVPCFM